MNNDTETDTLTKAKLDESDNKAVNNDTKDNDVNVELLEYTNENISNKKQKKHRLVYPILICILFILGFIIGINIYRHQRIIMPKDHVYICDNPEHLSDFETWIREEVGVTWVPTYIIVNDGYIIAAFEGNIPESEFTDKLGTALMFDMPFIEMSNFEIENLNGERKPANEIFSDGLYIIEYVWIDCEECEQQDANYTNEIYERYSTDNFYRYYVKSDKDKVEAKYN